MSKFALSSGYSRDKVVVFQLSPNYIHFAPAVLQGKSKNWSNKFGLQLCIIIKKKEKSFKPEELSINIKT